MSPREIPPGLRLLAEEMFAIVPPPPNANREVTERWILHMPASGNAAFTGVMRVRLAAGEVDAAVRELRERFAAAGRPTVAWWVGPSAEPPDLAHRLRTHGLRPLEHATIEARYQAMALLDEPGAPPRGVTARRVETLDEFRTATRIYFAVADPAADFDVEGPGFATWYEQRHVSGDSVSYLARIDGEAVATANAHFTADGGALSGGYTLEEHRGRGAYRALVHARWLDARAAGAPGLAVLAGSQSRPILERLGFQALGAVEVLVDDLSHSRAS